MSIVMNMFWSGITAADYDRLAAEVRWRENPPPGGRYHISWFTDEGARIVDVWDSAETFDEFTNQRLLPGVAATGLEGEPNIEILPLYDLQIEADPPRDAVVSDGMGGMPKEVYQAAERAMNWNANPPAGACAHIVAIDGDTIRDVGVWTSSAAIDAFLTGPFADTLAELDVGDPAEFEEEPVHPLHSCFDPTRVKTSS